ncbi:hypothetical protein MKW98_013749, partial [Papaver atlanticum]
MEEDESADGGEDWESMYNDLKSIVSDKWSEVNTMQQDSATVDASKLVLMLHEIYSKAFPLQRQAIHEDYVRLGSTPTQTNPTEDLDVDPTVEVQMPDSEKDQTNVNATSEVEVQMPDSEKDQTNVNAASEVVVSTTPPVLKFRGVEVQISE